MSSEASPDTRLHESNRRAHKIARLCLELQRAEKRYFDCLRGSEAEESAGDTIEAIDEKLYVAVQAYERFVTEHFVSGAE